MAASSLCFATGSHVGLLKGIQCRHGMEPAAGPRETVALPSCIWGQKLESKAAVAESSLRQSGSKEQSSSRRMGVVRAGKAKKSKEDRDPNYPWPEEISKAQGFLSFLSKFKDSDPDRKIMKLPFEKELDEMEKSYLEINEMARRTGEIADFQAVLRTMEEKMHKLRVKIYSNLSPVQRLSVARHPNRPTFLDHVLNITDKWVELHGDRGGYDDPALVCGIGEIDGMSFMLMGHQKGRNTKENIARNFGMPTPNGYRKALRLMRHAEHHGFPILTFIDTPGAYAGVSAEELGQGEAIAHNLRDMFGLTVPIVTTVIGEGGSGGALAIGCCDRMIMMENAVYYVASPEACAAILWKTAKAAPKATEALKITGYELQELNVVDEVIKEPIGGAHADPYQASMNVKEVIMKHVKELLSYDQATLESKRLAKFRYMGAVNVQGGKDNPRWHRNMKPREAPPMAEKVPPLEDVPLILANKTRENGRAALKAEAPVDEIAHT